ncbi:hypothetical protein [Bradyrhizobium prioriisuperbiae]|uniref:hypothetical protein n=1 Tax=Bradyrhizobium prioriisuperbiae TaxID=2854389 RepID=UPI0028E4D55F|nr:hypothetical protein [Bradyrhizobium prioritasuperba]
MRRLRAIGNGIEQNRELACPKRFELVTFSDLALPDVRLEAGMRTKADGLPRL